MTLDVFGLAGNAIANINPLVSGQIMYSTGYTTNADGSTAPTYNTVSAQFEVQALSSQDLRQVETINQQGDMRSVYIFGVLNALNRPLQIGGDKLIFYGSTWLVTQQLEDWGANDWSKVIVTRQVNP